MPQDTLRELLARVHEQLSGGSGSVDQESRQLLGTVMRDIERALHPAAAGDPAAQAPRLESLAVRFEAGHPGLAETLRELIDALVKAGI
jgi:Domain of unknown function (DUF4404)